MTIGLSVGKRYRFTINGRFCSGTLEGVLRSLSVPAGMLGNADGEHRVWIAGDEFEWFLRSTEIAGFEELREASEILKLSAVARPRRADTRPPYQGPCLKSGRRPSGAGVAETHPLLSPLAGRHRRGN
jgi:hypothetical protein